MCYIMVHVNKNIKNTVRVFPEQGRAAFYRYDMNENPDGLPKAFVDEVLQEITPQFLSIYPEPDRFLKKYASFVGVEPENLTVTNGSDMTFSGCHYTGKIELKNYRISELKDKISEKNEKIAELKKKVSQKNDRIK